MPKSFRVLLDEGSKSLRVPLSVLGMDSPVPQATRHNKHLQFAQRAAQRGEARSRRRSRASQAARSPGLSRS